MEMAASSSTNEVSCSAPANAFDELVPKYASSSAQAKKLPYDVFINHRGPDVKEKLASPLYHKLDLMGYRAFLDKEELEVGDDFPSNIQEAMSSASLHVAIFSPNYAQSPWCLAELSFMLKTGTRIIPVFYEVDPNDLRWVGEDKGVYAPAFSQHQSKRTCEGNPRYTMEKLKEWKEALQRVSFYSGYMLKNEDVGMLLKSIMNCLVKEMKNVFLEVAKHPVGLDKAVQDFESSTSGSLTSEQNVQIVGIVGMGGSGKTTLAKELYNRKRSSFDRHSFLFDIRDAAMKNELHNKQKKLLADLCGRDSTVDSIEEGKCDNR